MDRVGGHVQVIAVSGLPGAGKTTLSRALAQALRGARVFHYDDYETVTKWPPAKIQDWVARGADPNEINLDRLAADLAEARSRVGAGYILLDTPLGRSHRETAKLIDHAVWIDLPSSLALARQIGSQTDAVLQSRDPAAAQNFAAWLSGFLKSYESFIHQTYDLQMTRARDQADFVIDGRQPVEKMVAAVVANIESRAIERKPAP
jgi:uridine kinase